MDRAEVITALRDDAARELAAVLAMASAAYDEATHAESKAENQYDTRSLEASYLAAGQAVRVVALRTASAFYDGLDASVSRDGRPVGLGALVALEDDDGGVRWCFVAPEGGGRAVTVDGVPVSVITPGSPLGAALLGAVEGDVVSLLQPRPHDVTVLSVTAG